MNALDTALLWHSLGIATIPCLHRSKRPALQSWREFQNVLPRESQLRAWFSNPDYNLAVICGWENLVVIDFDCEVAFHQWWNGLKGKTACIIEQTHKVKTPRGYHFYFFIEEMPESVKLDKVDVKAHGTYVLAPPSIHPCGKPYIGYSTSGIRHLNSITDVLPDFKKALEQQRAKIQPKTYDAYEDAMRPWSPGNGASIEDIKARWSVADVLGYSKSPRRWQTKCPLSGHDDVVASFTIYPGGRWFCFGCQRGGDVIDLYAALHQTDIAGAMREMA